MMDLCIQTRLALRITIGPIHLQLNTPYVIIDMMQDNTTSTYLNGTLLLVAIKRRAITSKAGSGAKKEWGAKTRDWIGTTRSWTLGKKLPPVYYGPREKHACWHFISGWTWKDPFGAQGTASGKQGSYEWDATLQGQWSRDLQSQRWEKKGLPYDHSCHWRYFYCSEKAIVVCKEAVNRWTGRCMVIPRVCIYLTMIVTLENIWTMQSHCTNKYGIPRDEFNKAFNIDSELDTIE